MRSRLGRRDGQDPDDLMAKVLDGLSIDYQHKSGWQKMLCLFHDESTPSMTLNLEEGCWRCAACGSKGGDVYAFLMQYEHLTFPQAKERLKELTGYERASSKSGQHANDRVASGGWRPTYKRFRL